MIVAQLLQESKNLLQAGKIPSARLDATILISHVFSFTKEQILLNGELKITQEKLPQFYDLLNRRLKFEPISHLIGKREFFGENFVVSADVLDPRADSETLIEAVLKRFPVKDEKKSILEIGVGSGCLIVSLLMQRKNFFGQGIDISIKALEICQKNAIKHQVSERLNLQNFDLFGEIEFLSDDFDKDNSSKIGFKKNVFDLIISNPPYIPSHEIAGLQPEVAIYEPRIALDGGVDGLDFYRRIALLAPKLLNENGRIFLEIGIGQENEIAKIFLKNGFKLVESYKDLSGIIRILEFREDF